MLENALSKAYVLLGAAALGVLALLLSGSVGNDPSLWVVKCGVFSCGSGGGGCGGPARLEVRMRWAK